MNEFNMNRLSVLIVIFTLAGCGPRPSGPNEASLMGDPTGRQEAPETAKPRGRAPAPFELRLQMPTQVRSGASVPVTLRLTNTGTHTTAVEVRPQTSAFDVLISRADGTPVWHRMKETLIPDIVDQKTLQPGETLVFKASWDQRSDANKRVGPGTYVVQGILFMDRMDWETEKRTLEISP